MIYIAVPGGYNRGGVESLHQLANILNSFGHKTMIYYTGVTPVKVPDNLRKYNVEIADSISDQKSNILIVPETITHILGAYKNIRKCIWWLSWDFYVRTDPSVMIDFSLERHHLPQIMKPFIWVTLIYKRMIHKYRYHFEDRGDYFHLYNCEYVHQNLLKNGVPEARTLYMCGPLNSQFFEKAHKLSNNDRKNQILFNPKKGKEFTDKLICAAKKSGLNAEFIPIQGMSPDQIMELMADSKVYIDFGYFPGPERIPREAVTMGCNIITSQNGAASNDEDILIPAELKFEDREENIPRIIEKLRDMLDDYDGYYHYYDKYRKKVEDQPRLLCENTKLFIERI